MRKLLLVMTLTAICATTSMAAVTIGTKQYTADTLSAARLVLASSTPFSAFLIIH